MGARNKTLNVLKFSAFGLSLICFARAYQDFRVQTSFGAQPPLRDSAPASVVARTPLRHRRAKKPRERAAASTTAANSDTVSAARAAEPVLPPAPPTVSIEQIGSESWNVSISGPANDWVDTGMPIYYGVALTLRVENDDGGPFKALVGDSVLFGTAKLSIEPQRMFRFTSNLTDVETLKLKVDKRTTFSLQYDEYHCYPFPAEEMSCSVTKRAAAAAQPYFDKVRAR